MNNIIGKTKQMYDLKGACFVLEQNYEKAIRCLLKLEGSPLMTRDSSIKLAYSYAMIKKKTKSMRILSSIKLDEVEEVNELVEICIVYIFLDEMTIVKNYLEKLKGMNEKTSVTVLYSIIYYRQKKYEKSINMIEKLVNTSDKPVDIIFALEMYKSVTDKELLKKIINLVVNKYKGPEDENIIEFIHDNYRPYLEDKKSNKTT